MADFSMGSAVTGYFVEDPEAARIRKEHDRQALLDAILHLHNRCGKQHFPRGVENADERVDLKAARELDWSINRCLEDRSDNLEFLMDKLDVMKLHNFGEREFQKFLEDAQEKRLEKNRKNRKQEKNATDRHFFLQKIWEKIKHPFGKTEEVPEASAEASESASNSSNLEVQEVERFTFLRTPANSFRLRPFACQTIIRRMSQLSTEEVYEKAEEYWSSVASDVDGMLGGFEKLHRPDIDDSKKFIHQLRAL
uniref:Uncharacterized protein n=1 Tax=Panagrolaimus sp. JU765 TaxID=591449 RepID=A0AC34RGD7_9BILA